MVGSFWMLTTSMILQMEDMIADRVGAKEAELHATYDERLRNYDERYGSSALPNAISQAEELHTDLACAISQ